MTEIKNFDVSVEYLEWIEIMKGLIPPHLLLASANPLKMIQNLNHLLTRRELAKLSAELDRNVSALFLLGLNHFDFASALTDRDWRQKISRLYYSVYNARRAIVLKNSGVYSTDSSDHKTVDQLPGMIENRELHINNLKILREDRNLADYSHLAVLEDLVMTPDEAFEFSKNFFKDCRKYLEENGIVI